MTWWCFYLESRQTLLKWNIGITSVAFSKPATATASHICIRESSKWIKLYVVGNIMIIYVRLVTWKIIIKRLSSMCFWHKESMRERERDCSRRRPWLAVLLNIKLDGVISVRCIYSKVSYYISECICSVVMGGWIVMEDKLTIIE